MTGIFASFTRSEKWLISFVMLLVGGGYGIQQLQGDRESSMTFSASAAGPVANKTAEPVKDVLPQGLAESGRININAADGKLLETLPGIGPSLAGAIIRHREEHGPLASMADLDKVSGVGPAMISKLGPLVDFGSATIVTRGVPAHAVSLQSQSDLPVQAPGAYAGPASGASEMVNINTATAAELDLLTGVGPAIAQRILQDRQANGAYKTPEGLMRVKGIGPAIMQKNRGRIRVQ